TVASHVQGFVCSINQQHASDGTSYNFLALGGLNASLNNTDAAYAIAPSPNNKYNHGVLLNGQDIHLLTQANFSTTAGASTGYSIIGSGSGQGVAISSGPGTVSLEQQDFVSLAHTLTTSANITTQRFNVFQQPTIAGTAATKTVTTAATVDIV